MSSSEVSIMKSDLLNWYDYGARFYDPQIGRFQNIDLLAEVIEEVTPDHYCLNNPIANIDPTGMWTETANGYTTSDPQEIAEFFQNVVIRQDPQKQDPDKKKEEEKKRKEKKRKEKEWKEKYEKEKQEYEEKTGRHYIGLSVEDEEFIEQMVMGSYGGPLLKVAKELIAEYNTCRAVRAVLRDPNKIGHIFVNKHLFKSIIEKLGGEGNVVKKVMKEVNATGKLPKSGLYEVAVKVADKTVVVTGRVINGVPRIGTMYIPPE